MRARCVIVAVGVVLGAVGVRAEDDPRVAKGKQILGELTPRCTVCHTIEGKGNPKGPLDDVGSRWKPEELKLWLTKPAEMAKKHDKTRKPPMVPFPELEGEELDAVVAYLASLKKPSEQ